MINLRVGIQTRCLRQPLKQALHTAAQLGADGVEIDLRWEFRQPEATQTGLRQLRKMLDNLNLRVSAAAFPTRHGYDEPTDLERRLEATQAAMVTAYKLGAKVVINQVGSVPGDQNDARFSRLVQALTLLGGFGQQCGARLAAQAGSESGAQLAPLLEALPDESVGVDLNPSRLILNGHSPQEAATAVGRWVLHVHACDAVRGFSSSPGGEVELGRGTADLPSLLGQLEEFNYQGWVTIERQNAADPITEIGNAVAYLRSL